MAHSLKGKKAMSTRSRQNLSELVFLILDQTGTNLYIKGVRQNVVTVLQQKLESLSQYSGDCILTGSRAEGIVPQTVSDFDMMVACKGIFCVEDVNASEKSAEFVITKPDYTDAPPGYCKLAFGNAVNATSFAEFCFSDTKSDPFESKLLISSLSVSILFKLIQDKNNQHLVHDDIVRNASFTQGPAITQSMALDSSYCGIQVPPSKLEMDGVIAIYFYGKSFLKEWAERPRFHDWPPTDVIKDVSSMEGYLVPVGEKDSENTTLYWRISYVTAEKKLLTCFNSTLDKVYVMLKMLAKTVCTTVCPQFSSYIVKNVVLWVAETNPQCTEDTLVDTFLQCLNFLKLCLHNNHLPNYMIPKRNLLAGRIVCKEKTNLIHCISDLLDKGEEVVQVFPRLSQYIKSASEQPEMFLCYGMWRNYVETVLSILQTYSIEHMTADMIGKKTLLADLDWKNFKDERYFALFFDLIKLILPNYTDIFLGAQIQEGLDTIDKVLKEVLNIYLLD